MYFIYTYLHVLYIFLYTSTYIISIYFVHAYIHMCKIFRPIFCFLLLLGFNHLILRYSYFGIDVSSFESMSINCVCARVKRMWFIVLSFKFYTTATPCTRLQRSEVMLRGNMTWPSTNIGCRHVSPYWEGWRQLPSEARGMHFQQNLAIEGLWPLSRPVFLNLWSASRLKLN
jgi:hypothetical protein